MWIRDNLAVNKNVLAAIKPICFISIWPSFNLQEQIPFYNSSLKPKTEFATLLFYSWYFLGFIAFDRIYSSVLEKKAQILD